jgi:hypothetical protein
MICWWRSAAIGEFYRAALSGPCLWPGHRPDAEDHGRDEDETAADRHDPPRGDRFLGLVELRCACQSRKQPIARMTQDDRAEGSAPSSSTTAKTSAAV